MWSSEFLDSYESSSLEEKTSNLANEWRSEFVDNHEEALWKKLETEWLKQREGWAADGLENQVPLSELGVLLFLIGAISKTGNFSVTTCDFYMFSELRVLPSQP